MKDTRKYASVKIAPVVVRVGISLVFLWFGINQISNAEAWVEYLPSLADAVPLEAVTLVFLNGLFETVFGALLLLGLFTRASALLLSLHLVGIVVAMVSLRLSDIAVRDFGLLLALVSIFLYGPDVWSLDRKKFGVRKIKKRWEIWALIVLEILFVLCALSVVLYKILGIFDFGFLSYRFFNIVISVLLVIYIIWSLVRSERYAYVIVAVFSLFHLIEGAIISFWYKAVIHFAILLIVIWIYYKHKTLISVRYP